MSEKELLAVIERQRRYYREAVVRLAELLTKYDLHDFARVAISIAENYGIATKTEAFIGRQQIDLKEDESVKQLIIHELRTGELSGGMLREKTKKVDKNRYYKILNQLLDNGAVVRVGNTHKLIYKLAG